MIQDHGSEVITGIFDQRIVNYETDETLQRYAFIPLTYCYADGRSVDTIDSIKTKSRTGEDSVMVARRCC